MMYVLVGLCAVSIVLNIILVSYCTRLAHIANFWKDELKRETAMVRPVRVKTKVPVETLDSQDWEKEWD